MALSNRERVGRAFELLAAGLQPYVERRMIRATGRGWFDEFLYRAKGLSDEASFDDPSVLLRVMTESWDVAFRDELTRSDRNVVFELRDVRNRWAHNQSFSHDDAYRALDSVERLLIAVDAAESSLVGQMKEELMRLKYEAQAKKATPTLDLAVGEPAAGLKPWREVVAPHHDVAGGRFSLAEFAADLYQVRLGEGAAEYIDPLEFFRRTYLTIGLRQLLAEAIQRVTDGGGAPVVDLQTNFGGGKTHSMIALYHLFSGRQPHQFPQEVQDLLRELDVSELPAVQRAVLVGTRLKPGQPDRKPDGTEVRTLWGELAWHLGGHEAYDLVADSDRRATNPGDALADLLALHAPCLILIDEWIAFARQLYDASDLPAGTFDTHFTFAQALTEAARTVPGALLVVSIPASEALDAGGTGVSDVEVGGVAGHEALRRLRSVIGRMESSWRPATAEEAFEIVRRRLFQPIDPGLMPHRDATARAFGEFYRQQASEFPGDCRDPSYVRRMEKAYPIHPELFDRLYEDWSTLDRFQRTRGVLRLMANVIHALWESGDRSPLIMPASVPLDVTEVGAELTRNLEDQWKPIIDKDIDGPESLPVDIDNTYPNLGRYSAARRVARTVFLATAPRTHSASRGVEIARVKLGCALPGESVATFGDALTRLSDRATYLYVDGARYWFGTQPGVARMAQERAERYLNQARDEVHAHIVERLQPAMAQRDVFRAVHIAPRETGDVPDEPEARLVILGPAHPHLRSEDTPALAVGRRMLAKRGTAQRLYRNMLVFLAADQRRLDELERATASFLAWREVNDQADSLNLDSHQRTQAGRKLQEANTAIDLRLAETYQWLLVPAQTDPTGPAQWDNIRVEGQDGLAVRASRKLVHEDRLKLAYPPVLLRQVLDGVLAPLWSNGAVAVADVWDAFARYLYLPRLRDVDVLLDTIREGPASINWQDEGFATAAAFDGQYLDLVAGSHPAAATTSTLIVQPSAAEEQLSRAPQPVPPPIGGEVGAPGEDGREGPAATDERHALTRFYGRVTLDPDRYARDFGKVQQEVLTHLSGQIGAQLEIVVEIRARNQSGFEETTIRNVSENARTLRFDHHEFE